MVACRTPVRRSSQMIIRLEFSSMRKYELTLRGKVVLVFLVVIIFTLLILLVMFIRGLAAGSRTLDEAYGSQNPTDLIDDNNVSPSPTPSVKPTPIPLVNPTSTPSPTPTPVPTPAAPSPTPEATPDLSIEAAVTTIFYENDSYALSSADYAKLDVFVALAGTVKDRKIVVAGNSAGRIFPPTKAMKEVRYNLSRARAVTVAEYLKYCGIDESRILLVVNSADKPFDASGEGIPEGQAKNRRTEVYFE